MTILAVTVGQQTLKFQINIRALSPIPLIPGWWYVDKKHDISDNFGLHISLLLIVIN